MWIKVKETSLQFQVEVVIFILYFWPARYLQSTLEQEHSIKLFVGGYFESWDEIDTYNFCEAFA